MTIPTTIGAAVRRAATVTRHALSRAATALTSAARAVARRTRQLLRHGKRLGLAAWRTHRRLLRERPAYRVELLAVASASLALTNLAPTVVTALVALVRLYIAAHGDEEDSNGSEWT